MLLDNDSHSAANLAAVHTVSSNQFRGAVSTEQIDLGLTVTEDVDVSRPVIVGEDNHAQALGTKHGNYAAD